MIRRAWLKRDELRTIEREAIDPRSDLATALRRCVALGSASQSEALRQWATSELVGYSADEELPEYRRAASPLVMDGTLPGQRVKRLAVSATMVPAPVRYVLDEDVSLPGSISEILEMIRQAERSGEDFIRIGPPAGHYLVSLMNDHLRGSASVERVYWCVSTSVLRRVVEVVRTNLIRLAAEMRTGMPVGAAVPTKSVADAAVAVVVKGKKNMVHVQGVVATGDVSVSQAVTTASIGPASATETRAGRWIALAAGVVGAVAAVVALL